MINKKGDYWNEEKRIAKMKRRCVNNKRKGEETKEIESIKIFNNEKYKVLKIEIK